MSDLGKSQAIREARPEQDGMAREHRRNRLANIMFGEPEEPTRFGRFVVLDRIGEGGMGTVHSAYDPRLDRRVALKLLRSGVHLAETARIRFLREAQALARMSHPNVVPIHDAGIIDEQLFLVMEFVVGTTLGAWARERERDWRAVLSVYLQAGRGIAAAHALGVVHRDFKPDNAIVGDDGRVRVLDFGLARGWHGAEGEPDASRQTSTGSTAEDTNTEANRDSLADSGREQGIRADAPLALADTEQGRARSQAEGTSSPGLQVPLTLTGAIMGTPAYMAPEQFIGAQVGPEADQFSYCASLYEGLYGRRPFAGTTLEELKESVRAGRVREPPKGSGVPKWLFAVLSRGLQTRPDERFESMDALLAELSRDRLRTRKRLLIALLITALVGATLWSLTRSQPVARDTCAGAEQKLAGVWNEQRKAAVRSALLGTERPYASEAWTRVDTGLDRYRGQWVSMHRNACIEHQAGEQSGELLDRRMACLARRKSALASAVQVLTETQADSLANTVKVVEELPDIAYCANVEALVADVPPPEDPALARRVNEQLERLSHAENLENAGRYQEALTEALAVVEKAARLDYRPLSAEALLVKGRVTLNMGKREEAVKPLFQAVLVAWAAGVDRLALEALARYVYAEGLSAEGTSKALAYVPLGESMSERILDSGFGHALLLNNAGAVHMARGERKLARSLFARALTIKESEPTVDNIELINILSNLALLTEEPQRRSQLFEQALAELRTRFGDEHPMTLHVRFNYSGRIVDPVRAHESWSAVCALYDRYHREQTAVRVRCYTILGFLSGELDDPAGAAAQLDRASTLAASDAMTRFSAELAAAGRHFYRSEFETAGQILESMIERLRPSSGRWWLKQLLAQALSLLGAGQRALGRTPAAIASLEEAIDAFHEVSQVSGNIELQRWLARSQLLLAQLLWARGGQDPSQRVRERVMTLLDDAESWYRQAEAGNAARLRELIDWRQTHELVTEGTKSR